MIIKDLIPFQIECIREGHRLFEQSEIRKAKIAYPMKRLMQTIGDSEFVRETAGSSPFPMCEKRSFYIFKEKSRFVY